MAPNAPQQPVTTAPVPPLPQTQAAAPAAPAAVQTSQAAAPAPVAPVPQPAPQQGAYLALPVLAIGRVDVGRLLREVQALDNFLSQAAIRQPGTQPAKLPKTSRLLDDLLQSNHINVLHAEERTRLLNFLTEIYAHAPTLHMSFSADPSPLFMQKLMTWLRKEIHPLVLVQVGLQPNMGAGCVVRTTNKYFDFSLRSRFIERRDVLAQNMRSTA